MANVDYTKAWITPKDKFRDTSKYFVGDKLGFLTKKGVYAYDYMDSIDKFATN